MELRSPLVFFTGAGVSVGAGLPTYRGAAGIYTNSDLEPPHARDLDRLPQLWERLGPRLATADVMQPAMAHRVIAELEQDFEVIVITQNVDGLHQAAGSTRVYELHGSLRSVSCLACGLDQPTDGLTWAEGVPECRSCAGPCRPGVVLFGEGLPADTWESAALAAASAGTLIGVGTSGIVYPVASLLDPQFQPTAERLWVNPETAPPFAQYEWWQGSADDMLPRLLA